MNRCWPEGEWRAYLDRELPPRELAAGAEHLKECRRCTALSEVLEKRAERVGAWLGELETGNVEAVPEPAAVPVRRPAVLIWRPVLAAAAVLACAAVLFMALRQPPYGQVVRVPFPAPHAAVPVLPPVVRQPQPEADRSKPRGRVVTPAQYYIALDDEPIESGVVARVTLPDSGMLADVIYDDEGRPRAVRPLN